MASNFEDTSKWRLRTAAGVPYKILGSDGNFTDELGEVLFKVLIPANQLIVFLIGLMPPATRIGNMAFPTGETLPGLGSLAIKNVRFKSQDDNLPIDPFSFDTVAPDGTYYPVIQVDVTYSSDLKKKQTNENDPLTFLEISANTTGGFLHVPAPGAKWQPKTNPNLETITVTVGFAKDETLDPAWLQSISTGELKKGETDDDKVVNRDPNIPATVIEPKTEWSLKWPQVPFDFFRDVLVHRLRLMMGRVNRTNFPILFNAAPETVLFMGYNLQESRTWRDGQVRTPPVTVELKFVEKRVVWEGIIHGHNSFWRPGFGWQRLLYNGVDPMYRRLEFDDLLFKV